jgi:hypothetical protein
MLLMGQLLEARGANNIEEVNRIYQLLLYTLVQSAETYALNIHIFNDLVDTAENLGFIFLEVLCRRNTRL